MSQIDDLIQELENIKNKAEKSAITLDEIVEGGVNDTVITDSGKTHPSLEKWFNDNFASLNALLQGYVNDAEQSALDAEAIKNLINGGLHFVGDWDASTGVFPPDPTEGHSFYQVSVTGTISSTTYNAGDFIIFSPVSNDYIILRNGTNYISVGDVATSATVLETPRLIELSGDVTGSATFDGSTDININVTSSAPSTVDWTAVINTPTTIAGYGITDAASLTHNHDVDDLSNVTITSKVTNDILIWNGTAWVNASFSTAGLALENHVHDISDVNNLQSELDNKVNTGETVTDSQRLGGQLPSYYATNAHNHDLDNLTNVTISSNSSGEILLWNGTSWINQTLTEAGITPVIHQHTTSDITDIGSYTGFDSRYYTETEINNFFSGSNAISGYNKTDWDTAYSWGDHSNQEYVNETLYSQLNSTSTGLLSGGVLTINADDTKFDIAPAQVLIVDTDADDFTIVDYPGATAVTPTLLATKPVTYIGLDINGIVQSDNPFRDDERRSIVSLGVVVHSNNTNINTIDNLQHTSTQPLNQFLDFVQSSHDFSNILGNVYDNNSTNLELKRSAGKVFKLYINTIVDDDNPHTRDVSPLAPVTFRYRLQNSTEYGDTNNIDPDNYDNAGVLTSVGQNKFTIQRINMFPFGETLIQYGQQEYDTMVDAIAAINDDYVIEDNIEDNALLRSFLIVRAGTTDLSNPIDARFIEANRIGAKGDTIIPSDLYRSTILNNSSTGLLSGGILTINGLDNTRFDVSDGAGVIIDNTTDVDNPTVKEIFWSGLSSIAVTNIATTDITYILIDENQNIIQQSFFPTNTQLRSFIVLGALVHINRVILEGTTHIPKLIYNETLNTVDLANAIGKINVKGNDFSHNGANLQVSKTSGETFGLGFNYANSNIIPNNVTSPAVNAPDLRYAFRDGSGGITIEVAPTTDVKPGFWDDGTGVLDTVANNKWSIQRVYYFPETGGIIIAYGQETYAGESEARAAIESEQFEFNPPANSTVRCFLIVKGDATDLSDPLQATFSNAGKFGDASITTAVSTGNMQSAYDNSIVPQILTSVLGAFTVQAGIDNVSSIIEGKNVSGTTTFAVKGDGTIESNGNNVWHSGDFYPVGSAEIGGISQVLDIKDTQGTIIASVDLSQLNNEGTTITFNGTTEEIELRDDANNLLSSFPASSLVSNVGHTIGFNAGTAYRLELRNGSGSVLSSVDIEISRVNGLQSALDGKASLSHIHNTADITTGTFDIARIPDLPTSKITSGTFIDNRIAVSNVTQHEGALSIDWSQLANVPTDFTPSAHTLSSHTDVTLTSIGTGEILVWDGSAWINNTLAEANISTTSHDHSGLYANKTIDENFAGSLTVKNTIINEYGSGDTDITGLVSGTASGSIIETLPNAHMVIGIRGNDDTDGFYVIKDNANDGTYDELLFSVNTTNIAYKGNSVFHSGNFGKTEIDALNIDADTLDGIQGANYARTDIDETFNGSLLVQKSSATLLTVKRLSGDANIGIQFQGDTINRFFGLGASGELKFGTSADLNGAGDLIWHEGNFGKAEIDALNVDADTLDGLTSDQFLRASGGDTASGGVYNFYADATAGIRMRDTADATNNAQTWIQFQNSVGTQIGYMGMASSSNADIYLNSNNGSVRLFASGTERVRGTSTGVNLYGITVIDNDTTINTKLDVGGAGSENDLISAVTTGSGNRGITLETTATSANAPFLSWVDGDANAWRIRMETGTTLAFGSGFFTSHFTMNTGGVFSATALQADYVDFTTAQDPNIDTYRNGDTWVSSITNVDAGTSPITYMTVANFGYQETNKAFQIGTAFGSQNDGFYIRRKSDNASSENGANVWQNWKQIMTKEYADTLYSAIGAPAGDADTLDGIDSVRFVYGDSAKATLDGRIDLNTINKSGFYWAGTGNSNAPVGNGALVHINHDSNDTFSGQLYIRHNITTSDLYVRTKDNSTYRAWQKVITEGNSADEVLNVKSALRVVGNDTGTANSSWLGFYESDASTRQSYIGMGSAGSSELQIYNDTTGQVAIYANGNKSFVTSSSGADMYSNDTTGTYNFGRNSGERIRFQVTDGLGYFDYYQDETDGTDHSFVFRINSSNTGVNDKRQFRFNNQIIAGSTQIVTSSASLQVNGFQRTGDIHLHEGGGSPTSASQLLSNVSTQLTWDGAQGMKADSFEGVAYSKDDSIGGRIWNPGGAFYTTGTSLVTGAFKITLPTHGTADMLGFTVHIFDYTVEESIKLHISGYLYQTTGNDEWVNTSVQTISNQEGKDFTVRFGSDGSNHCVWIGETNSTWSYPQVFVTDFHAGFSTNVDSYRDGWDITVETAFDTVDATQNGNFPVASVALSANDAGTLDGIDSTGFARLGTTSPSSNYLYVTRNSASSVAYFRQAGAGPIARFFQSTTTSGTSSNNQVEIKNDGDIEIKNSTPLLILRDADHASGISQTGWIAFNDSANSERAWIGYGSSGDTNLTVKNHDGKVVLHGTSNDVVGDLFADSSVYVDGTVFWRVSSSDTASQRADARDEATTQSRLHWYGVTDTGGTTNFRHAWYDGSAYINVSANSGGVVAFTGAISDITISGNPVWHTGNDGSGSGLDADTVDGVQASSFLRADATDTHTGSWIEFNNSVRTRNGINGSYGNNAGTGTNWGATIWGIGDSFDGNDSGSSYSVSSLYGISWLRSSHASANSNIGEGLYIYTNASLEGGIGTTGIYSAGGCVVGGTITEGGTALASKYLGISAKAADSNLLDGLDSSAFLRSNAADTKTSGTLTFNDNISLAFGNSNAEASLFSNGTHLRLQMAADKDFYIYDSTTSRFLFDSSSGNFHADGTINALSSSVGSDPRLKNNIVGIENAYEKVKLLNGVTFLWNKNGESDAGILSTDVKKVLPEAVKERIILSSENGDTYESVSYNAVVGLLVEAQKDSIDEIEKLQNEKETLNTKVEALENEVEEIKEMLRGLLKCQE